jgi:hypothetical protein
MRLRMGEFAFQMHACLCIWCTDSIHPGKLLWGSWCEVLIWSTDYFPAEALRRLLFEQWLWIRRHFFELILTNMTLLLVNLSGSRLFKFVVDVNVDVVFL